MKTQKLITEKYAVPPSQYNLLKEKYDSLMQALNEIKSENAETSSLRNMVHNTNARIMYLTDKLNLRIMELGNTEMEIKEFPEQEILPREFKPFTESDWMGYAGAEKFSDGSEPMISESYDWELVHYQLIVDANGIEINWFIEDHNSELSTPTARLNISEKVSSKEMLLAMAVNLPTEITVPVAENLGFNINR